MKLRPAWSSRIVLSALLGAALASPQATAQTPIPESEPNNTVGQATPLPSVENCQAASGSITANDVDYYSFSAPPGSRVWALVDTSPSGFGNRDSLLRLFAPDGTTQLQEDDDDGTGTNCDGTIDNQLSSAIAGQVLSAGGTYFLRVENSFPGDPITTYRLTVVVTSSSQAEAESNNTAGTANPIVTAGSPIGVRTATIGTVGDVDFYSVAATAGSTLLISASGDPGTDVAVQLIQPNGTTVILTADASGGVSPSPRAESFCFNVTVSGTYYVRVFASVVKQTTGPYSLMVAACGLPTTPTPTATATRTPTQTATSIVGGPTSTPTPTQPPGTATATATRTATLAASSTPLGGVVPSDIPTLTFPMLLVMALGLVTAAFLVIRRT